MSAMFLEPNEIKMLTGRSYIRLQIVALKQMGIPFFVNGVGRPVVARSAVEGKGSSNPVPQKKTWVPNVLKNG